MSWMKPKSEAETNSNPEVAAESPRATPPPKRRESDMEKIVNIGQSVQIKGELMGKEDLTIEGKVDGKILVKEHNLTIGTNGHITAEVHAKTVSVLGHVTGNITADDKIEISESGTVEGDLLAPRVAIADGAKFRGSIDMGSKSASPSAGANASSGRPAGTGLPTS